jgi:GMP synthase-like glutamine amidotransferase
VPHPSPNPVQPAPVAPERERRSIALLECDHVNADLRHVAGDYGDMFEVLLRTHAPELDLHHVDVVGGEPLPSLDVHDGLVITGSRDSVYDDLPWIDRLSVLIRAAHAAAVPVVGICFGHQLIAQALGGRVARAEVGWGVGVHEATVTQRRPWMVPEADTFRLLMSHQDQVLELPAGAEVLATSPHAPIAAYELGTLVGFQGHPEFVADYLDALLPTRIERVGAQRVEAALASLRTPTDHATIARWMAEHLVGAGRCPPAS